MFRHALPIGRIFGVSVDLDYSWFLVFGLLTWILAVNYYPAGFKNWSVAEYWLMGAITAALLFVCVLLHELGHSIVAKRYGISVPRITLFIFGGVSEMAIEPTTPGVEFWIAAAGPIVSFALALIFWELRPFLTGPLLAMCTYLGILNCALGVLNLFPGFPLDGGRVFRSAMWRITGNFRRSNAVASLTGRFFGFSFIAIGVWQILAGNVFNGLWISFIGWFLEDAAASEDQLQVIKGLVGGHNVSEVMSRDFPQIAAGITLLELVDKKVLAQGHRCFVVTGPDGPVGLLTLSLIKEVPRVAWPKITASQVMIPLIKAISIQPTAELWTALEKMGREGVNQLPVINGYGSNHLVGMLFRDDLVQDLRILQALRR